MLSSLILPFLLSPFFQLASLLSYHVRFMFPKQERGRVPGGREAGEVFRSHSHLSLHPGRQPPAGTRHTLAAHKPHGGRHVGNKQKKLIVSTTVSFSDSI